MIDLSKLRNDMIKFQLIRRGIKDESVLNIMRDLPRENFVPEKMKKNAYDDSPLPIGEGQTISQPYMVAIMTEVLKITKEDTVLEIGTGSGYQTAILSRLCKTVHTVEINETLLNNAEVTLNKFGCRNVYFHLGNGKKGLREYAPFDKILVAAAPENIPSELISQLKNGGRMIIPIGARLKQELILIIKSKNSILSKSLFPVLFVPLI